MHLDSSFGVFSKSPFCLFDTARNGFRVNGKELPSEKIHIWDAFFGVYRTNLANDSHSKFFEDSIIPRLIHHYGNT